MMYKIFLKADQVDLSATASGKDHLILQEVGFDLYPGETLGIVGPSGSGKTMLARALIGLLPDGIEMTSGDIQFHPEEGNVCQIKSLSPGELDSFRRAHVAMIFQNPGLSLNPSMRIEKQFRIVSALSGSPASPEKCATVLNEMGFLDPQRILAAYPHQLSGGELQRVIIGMTILKSPRFWIADEPTTALDAGTKAEIVNLLGKARERLSASMIYISHDPGTVRRLADRVVFMRQGRIEKIEDVGALSGSTSAFRKGAGRLNGGKPVRASRPPAGKHAALEVEGVSKQFGQGFSFGLTRRYTVEALKDISFRLDRGETIGVIGPSGSGKSTLGRVLTGLEKADAGSARFFGKELMHMTNGEWHGVRRQIQLIHQNPAQSLTPQRTVEQHLVEALQLSGRVSGSRDTEGEIEKLMAELALPRSLRSRFSFQISGGECQRVAIARALALRPSIVICDEITSALDPENQQQLLELMARLKEDFDFSLLWITHDLNVVRQVADRLILLDKGELIEESAVEDFFLDPASAQGKHMLNAYRMFS